jgi:carboxylesterase type B
VRGYLDGGVFTFKGVPYGQDTGGANRWLPAKPPTSWSDERHTLIYGANCPQNLHDFKSIQTSFLFDWDDGYLGEDMLKLNIWTPALSGKRPVMVYFHGGGFSFGSAYELPSHDGAQMARHHGVVQVSVNHRLNALGFLDVSEIGGPDYGESSNVGMTDLVAALRWVRDNIANFGGDPNRVMIYGQSGGGSKVTCLMGMPSAKGLFSLCGGAIGRRRQFRRRRTVARPGPPVDGRAGIEAQRHRRPAADGMVKALCGRPGCNRQGEWPAAAGPLLWAQRRTPHRLGADHGRPSRTDAPLL